MQETCFVIMPIGSQTIEGIDYTEIDLKKKYDDLIKEAILKVKPDMTVYRADDVSMPGSITNDIFTKLMYSRYVIADISLPNPNVFYELGIRHAIRAGTILLKDKNIKSSIFDISHLRYIEYENSPTGIKELAKNISRSFSWIEANPTRVDNQFLELASFTKFRYPQFIDFEEENRKKNQALLALLAPFAKKPELMKILMNQEMKQDEKNAKFFEEISKSPEIMSELFIGLVNNGW